MKIYLIIFLTIAGFFSADAQSASEDLLKMHKAYSLHKDYSYSMTITYSAFSNYTTKTPTAVQQGFLKKRGDSQLSFLAGIQSLSTKDYNIIVDTTERQIVIGNPIKQNLFAKQVDDLEKILKLCSSVSKIESKPTQIAYKLTIDPKRYSEFSSAEFYLSKKTFFLEKVVLYYNMAFKSSEDENSSKEKPRLEIIFSNINTNPKYSAGMFSEKQFINVSDNGITVSKNYSGYELINQKIPQ